MRHETSCVHTQKRVQDVFVTWGDPGLCKAKSEVFITNVFEVLPRIASAAPLWGDFVQDIRASFFVLDLLSVMDSFAKTPPLPGLRYLGRRRQILISRLRDLANDGQP